MRGMGRTWAVAGGIDRGGAGPEEVEVGRGSVAGDSSPVLTGASGRWIRMYRPDRARYNPWASRRWFRNADREGKKAS